MQEKIGIPKGSEFRTGQKFYIFGIGEAAFLREGDFDAEYDDVRIEFKVDDKVHFHGSYWCFARSRGGWYHRDWTLGKAKVRVRYQPNEHVIEILLLSEPYKVQYSANPNDCEYFEAGDKLHKDWEGAGIDIGMIVNKWLLRLNGEMIPLSDYFMDPFNRWVDGR